jgi:hypothetical protein
MVRGERTAAPVRRRRRSVRVMTVGRVVAASLALAAGVAAFVLGRATAGDGSRPAAAASVPRGSYADGYRAGREDAFSGFDGGWDYATPYIVTLRRGGPGITYAFARRVPLRPGVEYRACGRGRVCSRGQ